MPETLFISDLHLDQKRPEIIQLFNRFIASQALHCEALYILGDLFEYWIGDDQPLQGGLESVIENLKALTSNGIPVYLAHGNRDFLIGKTFAYKTGINLLPETTTINLYGHPTLLMHGDTLCTDDIDYQNMRTTLRDTNWQKQFLALPLKERIQKAQELREKSLSATKNKHEDIMDVSSQSVESAIRAHNVNVLIHGHTHRPAIHKYVIEKEKVKRVVLGDWYLNGSMLRAAPHSLKLETILP
jgi:UDP-2,3-diacylglucosamine hydrolase